MCCRAGCDNPPKAAPKATKPKATADSKRLSESKPGSLISPTGTHHATKQTANQKRKRFGENERPLSRKRNVMMPIVVETTGQKPPAATGRSNRTVHDSKKQNRQLTQCEKRQETLSQLQLETKGVENFMDADGSDKSSISDLPSPSAMFDGPRLHRRTKGYDPRSSDGSPTELLNLPQTKTDSHTNKEMLAQDGWMSNVHADDPFEIEDDWMPEPLRHPSIGRQDGEALVENFADGSQENTSPSGIAALHPFPPNNSLDETKVTCQLTAGGKTHGRRRQLPPQVEWPAKKPVEDKSPHSLFWFPGQQKTNSAKTRPSKDTIGLDTDVLAAFENVADFFG